MIKLRLNYLTGLVRVLISNLAKMTVLFNLNFKVKHIRILCLVFDIEDSTFAINNTSTPGNFAWTTLDCRFFLKKKENNTGHLI